MTVKSKSPNPTDAANAKKDAAAKRSRDLSASSREIGDVPKIANVRRRAKCRDSLRLFCEIYNPRAFGMKWSPDHLRVIERLEEAARLGAMFAFAMPRGSGKTTLCRHAALWAVSYSHRRYAFVIGANQSKANDTLDAIRTYVRYLPLYAADFPEIAFPVQKLGGIANRAAGQTCVGKSTLIEWTSDRIVFPTVKPPKNWPRHWEKRADGMVPTSGSVLSASGLTGDGIRGSLLTLTTGESVRPDLVLLDDPQTNESAHSPTQNATREQLVAADVLGMAGPGKTISAVMPCTVIAKGDFVDRMLDRERHPVWRGERTKMLTKMPVNMSAWNEYLEVYHRCVQKEPPDLSEANAYYEEHRIALDSGAEASWIERKLATEVSAIQHAMHLFARDRRAFMAEFQNEPEDDLEDTPSVVLSPDVIAKRTNAVDRLEIPRDCTRITAFVDVGGEVLWYAVTAWSESFGGGVIDYGTWPRQNRDYFLAADARPKLSDVYRGLTEPQRVHAGLRDLTSEIIGREYYRQDTGEPLRVERCLIDAGWIPDTVHGFVRSSSFAQVLHASKGHAAGSNSKPVSEWQVKSGERAGRDWRLSSLSAGRGRVVVFDPNAWKSFVADRLTTAPGGGGALMLFAPGLGRSHQLLADHICAEFATRVTAKGRTYDAWQVRPGADNHLLDCLVGSAVAASVQGLRWTDSATVGDAVPAARPRLKLSEYQAQKRQMAGRS